MTIITIQTASSNTFARIIMNEVRRRLRTTPPTVAGRNQCFTQKDLAAASGYGMNAINQWVSGLRTPTLRQALDVLEATAL